LIAFSVNLSNMAFSPRTVSYP